MFVQFALRTLRRTKVYSLGEILVKYNPKTCIFIDTFTSAARKMSSPSGTGDVLPKRPFLIGVSGGTASGKTTVCRRIMERLAEETAQKHVTSICQDSFYRELSETDLARAKTGSFNFDHPDAFDNELMLRTLTDLLQGKSCQIPQYDYTKHSGKK